MFMMSTYEENKCSIIITVANKGRMISNNSCCHLLKDATLTLCYAGVLFCLSTSLQHSDNL